MDTQHDVLLSEFRDKYGKVARLTVAGESIYIRGLDFVEWADITREMKMTMIDGNIDYEVTEKGMNRYIVPAILSPVPLPERIRSKAVNMNLLATTVLNITDFDDQELLLKKYKRALARQQLLASDVKRQLIGTYGIAVLDYMKGKGVDDMIDLLAIGEWMKEDIGAFGRAIGVDDLIPLNKKHQLDYKKLMERMNEWLYEGDVPKVEEKPQTTISSVQPGQVPPQVFDAIEATRPKSHLEKEITDKQHTVTTISDINLDELNEKVEPKKQDLTQLKEPKLYNTTSELDPVMQKRNKMEFNGDLINIWNESQVKLYETIMNDLENPKKFKSGADLVKEDLKVNENFEE